MEVVRDFSDYYNNSISISLEKIHQLKYLAYNNPKLILDINIELDEVYIKIRGKLKRLHFDNYVSRMDNINRTLSSLDPLKKEEGYDRIADHPIITLSKTKHYKVYRAWLKNKEILLWEIMETLGMTGKVKDKSKIIG